MKIIHCRLKKKLTLKSGFQRVSNTAIAANEPEPIVA